MVIKDKNGGPDKLWVFGQSETGDFIYSDGTITPADHTFSERMDRTCAVQLEDGDVLIMGGNGAKKTVRRYNPTDGTVTFQTDMINQRSFFACTTFKSEKHGKF